MIKIILGDRNNGSETNLWAYMLIFSVKPALKDKINDLNWRKYSFMIERGVRRETIKSPSSLIISKI